MTLVFLSIQDGETFSSTSSRHGRLVPLLQSTSTIAKEIFCPTKCTSTDASFTATCMDQLRTWVMYVVYIVQIHYLKSSSMVDQNETPPCTVQHVVPNPPHPYLTFVMHWYI